MPESGSGNLKHEDGVQTDGAVGQAGDSADGEGGAAGKDEAPDEPLVRVYLAEEGRVETVPLETYVLGVVAGEMPADFELEALKAQAIAARTYIIRKLFTAAQDTGDVKREYDVTDGEADQVYVPLEENPGNAA